MAGLQSAAQQLASYGRGPDTMLAHISPDEAEFIDAVQGGRRTNPMTGLPEYGLFGKILKAAVRIGGAIGGFMIGGPAGAAAGSGAATKLTGGSWKQALKAGAISGVGSLAAQGLTGGGWGLTGAPAAGGAGAGSAVGAGSAGLSAAPSAASTALSAGLPTGATAGLGASIGAAGAGSTALGASPGFFSGLASAAPAATSGLGGIGAALAPIGGYAGAAAGLGALSTPLGKWSGSPMPQLEETNINLNVKPYNRKQIPFTGDYGQYAGHQFFEDVNPQPEFLARGGGVRRYNVGGGVMPMQQPGVGLQGLGGLRNPGIPSQIETPHIADPVGLRAMARDNSPGAQRAQLRQAAIFGYMNAKDGGPIRGPGTGTSDSIPAMLSDGEHVWDEATVTMAGGGNNDKGQKVLEKMKQRVRSRAGVKNPKKPPAFQGKK